MAGAAPAQTDDGDVELEVKVAPDRMDRFMRGFRKPLRDEDIGGSPALRRRAQKSLELLDDKRLLILVIFPSPWPRSTARPSPRERPRQVARPRSARRARCRRSGVRTWRLSAQRRLRVGIHVPRQIGEGEEQVAQFILHGVVRPASISRSQFVAFFPDLGEHEPRVVPVEPDSRRLLPGTYRAGEAGQGFGHARKNAVRRPPAAFRPPGAPRRARPSPAA